MKEMNTSGTIQVTLELPFGKSLKQRQRINVPAIVRPGTVDETKIKLDVYVDDNGLLELKIPYSLSHGKPRIDSLLGKCKGVIT